MTNVITFDPTDPYAGLGLTSPVRDLVGSGGGRKPLRVLTPDQCGQAPRREYLVKGMVARGDVVLLIGAPGFGKSVIAPYLAYAVAQGRAVWGMRVRQAPVLYLAAEDGNGMTARVNALRRRCGEAPDFRLVPDAMDLLGEGGHLDEVRGLARDLRPGLIVLDTLNQAFPGLRENESEDMGRVVAAARSLAGESGAAVLLVHHGSKAAPNDARGHGSLHGAADVTLFGEGEKGEPRVLRFAKNRNGSSCATHGFQIEVETLGTDEDGDAITAVIAALEENEGAGHGRDIRDGLPVAQRTALDLLDRAIIAEGGTPPPSPNVPPGTRGVPQEVWRRYCYEGQITAGEEASSRRKAFTRASSALQDRKLIGVWADWVWVAAPPRRQTGAP